jgi:hypothetical protein
VTVFLRQQSQIEHSIQRATKFFSPLCVFSVGDRVTNDLVYGVRHRNRDNHPIVTHVLEENLQNTTGLLINKTRDTLHTTTTGETTNGLESLDKRQTYQRTGGNDTYRLRDTLYVITKDLAVAFGTSPKPQSQRGSQHNVKQN